MVYPGYGDILDTPRTNLGDATYLSQHQPDLDISQEASFVSPTKDDAQQNLFAQLRGGRSGATIRTPRRGPLADRRNIPDNGPEFTPLLKSATRNGGFRRRGKENGNDMPGTPTGLLDRIEEDLTPIPALENSILGRSVMSIGTPLPADASSVASTPLNLPPRRNFSGKGPLDDGNQMSLREQENVIDKIEKENFGLKLKIHFLEEALRKAGPGFSEAALKENTELKVDKVTMQRDLQRYKKHLNVAEKDLEQYRQQMIELQERSKRKYADDSLKAEAERLRQDLEDKESEIDRLQAQLEQAESGGAEVDKLRDEITDLEAELREKERLIAEHQDEMEDLREKLDNNAEEKVQGALQAKDEELGDLQQNLQDRERALDEKEDEVEELQRHLREKEQSLDQKEDEVTELQQAVRDKQRQLEEKDDQVSELQLKANRLADREAEIEKLKDSLRQARFSNEELDNLQEKARQLENLNADRKAEIDGLREKLRRAKEQEIETDQLRARVRALETRDTEAAELEQRLMAVEARSKNEQRQITELETRSKADQRRLVELEQQVQDAAKTSDDLEFARDTIEDLERKIRDIESESDDIRIKMEEALVERERAEADLEELQEEMANKSTMSKSLSRQIDEKAARLQMELEQAGKDFSALEKQYATALAEGEELRTKAREAKRERDTFERDLHTLKAKYTDLEAEVEGLKDQKLHLQSQHDNVAQESASLQKEAVKLRKLVSDLETSLSREREKALDLDRDARDLYSSDIDRLNEEIFKLQAEIHERDNLYDTDSDKWENEKRALEIARDRAEQKATDLQRAVENLRQAGDTLSSKETRLQDAIKDEADRHNRDEAVLSRRIEELQHALEIKQSSLSELRTEISNVREELRHAQSRARTEAEKAEALADEVEVLQAVMEEDAENATREKEDLKAQIETLRAANRAASLGSHDEVSRQTSLTLERLRTQLSESSLNFSRVSKEKMALQEQVATISLELKTIRESIAEVRAERDELEAELKSFSRQRGEETYRIDQERVDLRAARTKLEAEVGRLSEEKELLERRRAEAERSLEDEIERAAEEENKLAQEISKLRQASSSSGAHDLQELSAARRTIRDLERQRDEYQSKLAAATTPDVSAGEGSSEILAIRQDLLAARQKELDYLSRESSNKEVVRGLKKRIAELERSLHEAEMSKLLNSPMSVASSPGSSSHRAEIELLRKQVTSAQQSLQDSKAKLREAGHRATQSAAELRNQLADVEDERAALEESLDEARREADDLRAEHERESRKLALRLEKAEKEAASAVARAEEIIQRNERDSHSSQEAKALKRQLTKALAESDALEHDVRMQFATIESLTASESSLRKKLERTRSERAAFRAGAEKLARDFKALQASADDRECTIQELRQELARAAADDSRTSVAALTADIQAAEEKHRKELRGLVMQMEWMQARWEREAGMRADAAFAKRFLQLQLDVANACNTAQLRQLEHIRRDVLGDKTALTLPSSALKSLSPTSATSLSSRPTLKTVALVVRFVMRARRGAALWQKQEATRAKIVEAVEDMKKKKRVRDLRSSIATGTRRQGGGLARR
ncbi:Spindle pole body protein pcp1 [Ceratocystis lukuohia]|uniref:Spindle pole body protein pcp1 n=1 Tax=Ceratocystis lukuohia TaxID=2019550 RepID=A0ABR4MP03_9PEZI